MVGALAVGVALAQQPVQEAVTAIVAPTVLLPAGTLGGIATVAFAAVGATPVACPQELAQSAVFESACAWYDGDFASFKQAWATATAARLRGRLQSEWGYSELVGAHVLSYDLGADKGPDTAFMAAFHPLPNNKGEIRVSLRVR